MVKMLGLALALCCPCGAWAAASAADGLGVVEVLWEHPLSDTFSFGEEDGSWSQADRAAVELRLPTDTGSNISPWGGLHVAGDTRTGSLDARTDGSGGGKITADALVLALTGGGRFHLLERSKRTRIDPAVVCFGRAGVGFQNGEITDYQTAQGRASGELSPLRYEFALGAAFELALGSTFLLSAGGGVTWMFANQATIIRVENGQGTAAVNATYAGLEGFSRLGLGIRF